MAQKLFELATKGKFVLVSIGLAIATPPITVELNGIATVSEAKTDVISIRLTVNVTMNRALCNLPFKKPAYFNYISS